MANKDYLPEKDKDFLVWSKNFLANLSQIRYNVSFPDSEYLKLSTECNDFEQKLEASENPATRTSVTVEAKNIARKLLRINLRVDVKAYLTFNPSVTDDDRKAMGLPVHKTTRTPSKVADKAPDTDVDTSVPGRVTVHFFEKSGSHKRAKPEGQHCIEMIWIISDTPPAKWEDLIHSIVDTNSPVTLSFENDQRGKTLYFALRWENTRGEKGPWTEIQSTIIP
jgi:hypothetical protein